MFPTTISQSNNLTLNGLIARLGQHDAVDGILLMGSTGQDTVSPASDYDLVVVLSTQPEPIALLPTLIDQRLAEVYFFSTDMTEDLGSIRELVLRQAKGKIGTNGFRVIRHFLSFHRAWAVAAEAFSDRQLGFCNFRRQRVHVNIP